MNKKHQLLLFSLSSVACLTLAQKLHVQASEDTTMSHEMPTNHNNQPQGSKPVEDSPVEIKQSTLPDGDQTTNRVHYEAAKKAEYQTTIKNDGYTVDNLPWGEKNFKRLSTSKDHKDEAVKVMNESPDGYYAEVTKQNGEYVGWVDKKAFDRKAVKSYDAKILYPNYTIDTKPWGEKGFKRVALTGDYINQTVRVVQEDQAANYALALYKGVELGWIDKRAFADAFNAVKPTEQRITRAGYTVDSKPWGVKGFSNIDNSRNLLGQSVQVIGRSDDKHYSFIQVNGKNYGWIDNKALESDQQLSTRWIVDNHFIMGAPWGQKGAVKLGTTESLMNTQVQIVNQSAPNGYYFAIDKKGKGIGWIDHRAFANGVNYSAQIVQDRYSIDTKPWGTKGFKNIGRTADYLYEVVDIVAHDSGQNYGLAIRNNKALGWIDLKAFMNRNYQAQIIQGNHAVMSKPAGFTEANRVANTSGLLYEEVQVVAHNNTNKQALVRYRNRMLGWIELDALSAERGIPHQLNGKDYTLSSKIFGTRGAKTIGKTTDLKDQYVEVLDEKEAYSLIRANGKLAWVDNRAIKWNTTKPYVPGVIKPTNEQKTFIQTVAPYARKYSDNIFPSITIAQAILESGWGKSRLAKEYNNYFGIKGNFKGKSARMATLEDDGKGNYYQIRDDFRAYPTPEYSFADHDALFTASPWLTRHYAKVRGAQTVEEQANHLQGTYATDTKYAEKLMNLINGYNLKVYDL